MALYCLPRAPAVAAAGVEPPHQAPLIRGKEWAPRPIPRGNGHPLALITGCTLMDRSKSERIIMPTGKLVEI